MEAWSIYLYVSKIFNWHNYDDKLYTPGSFECFETLYAFTN